MIAPCQGEGEIREYQLPVSETHKGPFQPQGLLLSNIVIRTQSYQSIRAVLQLKCIINFHSLPYLVYCASKIHSQKVRSFD